MDDRQDWQRNRSIQGRPKVIWESRISNWQKSILSLIGAVTTAAIGLASVVTAVANCLLPTIVVLVFAALVTFIFFSFLKIFGERIHSEIYSAFSISIESLSVIDGFVAASSFDLDVISVRQLYVIGQFTKIVGVNRLYLYDAFEQASKATTLRLERQFLNQNSLASLSATIMAYGIYTSREDLMMDNVLESLSYLLGDFLRRRNQITQIWVDNNQGGRKET
jgi:hypothetical protein